MSLIQKIHRIILCHRLIHDLES
jgi:hypothetical protein